LNLSSIREAFSEPRRWNAAKLIIHRAALVQLSLSSLLTITIPPVNQNQITIHESELLKCVSLFLAMYAGGFHH
jgi:hypothetical protein